MASAWKLKLKYMIEKSHPHSQAGSTTSSWKLYLDDFPFFSSSLAHLEPELELFEVWEMMVRQIIITIIAIVLAGRTSNK